MLNVRRICISFPRCIIYCLILESNSWYGLNDGRCGRFDAGFAAAVPPCAEKHHPSPDSLQSQGYGGEDWGHWRLARVRDVSKGPQVTARLINCQTVPAL